MTSEREPQRYTLFQKEHDEVMEENFPSMLDCLSDQHIVSIQKTDNGVRFVEMCDEHFGCTLTAEQVKRLILELKQLIDN